MTNFVNMGRWKPVEISTFCYNLPLFKTLVKPNDPIGSGSLTVKLVFSIFTDYLHSLL